MMQDQLPFANNLRVPDFRKSLRDACRGVANLADATEEVLETAAVLLPGPIRSRFLGALHKIEDQGRRLAIAPVSADDIALASAFVRHQNEEPHARDACVIVFGYAWEFLHQSADDNRTMISETVLGGTLAKFTCQTGAPSAHAAHLFFHIRESLAAGRMPGFVGSVDDSEREKNDLTLLAIIVWLMSARGEVISEEEKLLHLSSGLVMAMRDEIVAALDDAAQLAAILQFSADHV
jgi:hypothetical protein